jgi:Protein of unknown function (DUF3667)
MQERELTLRGFVEQVAVAFTNVDSRLMRSLVCLLTRPGALTVAYLQGQRRPYIRPLQLFLIANVLFFAIESLTNSTIFSTPLDSHLHKQPWDGLLKAWCPIACRLSERPWRFMRPFSIAPWL